MCFVASWSVQYSFCGSLVVRKGLRKTGLLIDWMVSRPAMLNGWKSYYKIQRWVIAVNTVYGKIVSENAIDILRQDHVQTYGDVVTWLLLLTLLEVIYTDIEAMNKVRRSASSCEEWVSWVAPVYRLIINILAIVCVQCPSYPCQEFYVITLLRRLINRLLELFSFSQERSVAVMDERSYELD